jgi:hypothetical protein
VLSICRQAVAWILVLVAGGAFSPRVEAQAGDRPAARVRTVKVTTNTKSTLEVEIVTSQPVPVRSQVTTSPDRLVLDFPNALPGSGLRNQAIQGNQVKGIRVGLFANSPPVTRVVLDLNGPQRYQIFPSGRTVLVRLAMSDQARGQINKVSYTPPPPQPAPTLEVEYRDGRLSILADRVSLAEVLNQIHLKTGADISVPPAAAQEQVVTNIAPAPVREALSALLNGSRFNFILVSADSDPSELKSVILSFRGSGVSQPAQVSPQPAVRESEPETFVQEEAPPEPQPQPQESAQPEGAEQQAQPPQGNPPQENPPPAENPPPQ